MINDKRLLTGALLMMSVILGGCSTMTPDARMSPAEFVTQQLTAERKIRAYGGSAAERRVRLAERARSSYEYSFDLGGLPAYEPKKQVAGTIRMWGNNYVGDSGLAEQWREAFQQFHPDVTFEFVLPTAAVAAPALSFGLADIGMNHGLSFYDILGHVRILGYEPTGFSVVTGSYDIGGWQNSFAIVVHKDNPLSKITMRQLDGVFGSRRAGGWRGTRWDITAARGPEEDIRTWDQLGLQGDWAGARINPYGYSLRYATALEFSNKVLHASDKWNENLLAYGNYIDEDGVRTLQADQIIQSVKNDPYGIAYIRWRPYYAEDVKVLALAQDDSGTYYDFTVDNLQARLYPLWGDQSFWVSVKPGETIEPATAEFVRFVLSREGQTLVMEDGKYLPLPASSVSQELNKLSGLE